MTLKNIEKIEVNKITFSINIIKSFNFIKFVYKVKNDKCRHIIQYYLIYEKNIMITIALKKLNYYRKTNCQVLQN